jgi:hypothetical protein
MERRSFFAAVLGALGLSTDPAPRAESSKRHVELLRAPLAGYSYYQADRVLNTLNEGTPLVLRREPANPYDRHAVEILTTDGVKLGYIPRVSVRAIARNLDRGIPVRARICQLNREDESWRRIQIECFVEY